MEETSTIAKSVINISLGINLNDEFDTYDEFDKLLKEKSRQHFLHFWKRDCRTVEGAKKKTDRYIDPKIKYYQLKYSCIQGGRIFRKKNTSMDECEANFYLTATPNGNKLFVKSLNNNHNHEVSEEIYLKYFNGDKFKRGSKKKSINTQFSYSTGNFKSESEDTITNCENVIVKQDPFTLDSAVSIAQYDVHGTSESKNSNDTDDETDKFLKYIASEMRQIHNHKVLQRLKRKFIALVQEAQDEDETK